LLAFDFSVPSLGLALPKRADKIAALDNKNGLKKFTVLGLAHPLV